MFSTCGLRFGKCKIALRYEPEGGEENKTSISRIAMMAAGAMVLGTMAYGQTNRKANVPFAFRTAMGALPAGEYTVEQGATFGGTPVTAMAGPAAILFRCAVDRGCVLVGVRTAEGAIKVSSREKETGVATIAIPLRAVHGD